MASDLISRHFAPSFGIDYLFYGNVWPDSAVNRSPTMYVVDQWSTSRLAWYQGVAGWERPARLHDLSDSGGIGGIGGVPVTQACGMDTAAGKCPL